jgi:hypothetical protein
MDHPRRFPASSLAHAPSRVHRPEPWLWLANQGPAEQHRQHEQHQSISETAHLRPYINYYSAENRHFHIISLNSLLTGF